jgi:polyvinyl alcohol dehydrogenase (cytochrome)
LKDYGFPQGRSALIGAQKSGVVTAVDPDHSGEIIWQKKVGRGGKLGGVQWGVATDESTVYVAVSELKLNAVAPCRRQVSAHPVSSY